jgi:hypothetical protein
MSAFAAAALVLAAISLGPEPHRRRSRGELLLAQDERLRDLG